MAMMRDDNLNSPGQQTASDAPSGLLAEVRLLNDDHTPMEFVVQVLKRVFGKDRQTATRLMLEIHNRDSARAGYIHTISPTRR
jgi:ATP-dependent Clp protease adapter protein ClpS